MQTSPSRTFLLLHMVNQLNLNSRALASYLIGLTLTSIPNSNESASSQLVSLLLSQFWKTVAHSAVGHIQLNSGYNIGSGHHGEIAVSAVDESINRPAPTVP